MVVLPELRHLLGWHCAYLLPFVEQCAEVLVALVGLFGSSGQQLYLLYDGQLLLEVLLAFPFQGGLQVGATLAYGLHGGLELLLGGVKLGDVVVGVTPCLYEGLPCCQCLCVVVAVVELFEEVKFLPVARLAPFHYGHDPGHHLILGHHQGGVTLLVLCLRLSGRHVHGCILRCILRHVLSSRGCGSLGLSRRCILRHVLSSRGCGSLGLSRGYILRYVLGLVLGNGGGGWSVFRLRGSLLRVVVAAVWHEGVSSRVQFEGGHGILGDDCRSAQM